MSDFRLKVFYTVAKLLNFTKAASLLHVTQPAVTKHIKELELYYNTILFDRQPNALALTETGQILFRHAKIVMEQYSLLDFELQAITNKLSGTLKIGATTTLAQYILPPVLAAFHKYYPGTDLHMADGNTSHILSLLMDKHVDIAFTEEKTNNNDIQSEHYMEDKIVLVTSTKNKILNKGSIKISDIAQVPLILNNGKSTYYGLLIQHLQQAGITVDKLNVKMHTNNTESIKMFLEHGDCFAFLSVHEVINELAYNTLSIIDIDGLEMTRHFYIATFQGATTPLSGQLLKLIASYRP